MRRPRLAAASPMSWPAHPLAAQFNWSSLWSWIEQTRAPLDQIDGRPADTWPAGRRARESLANEAARPQAELHFPRLGSARLAAIKQISIPISISADGAEPSWARLKWSGLDWTGLNGADESTKPNSPLLNRTQTKAARLMKPSEGQPLWRRCFRRSADQKRRRKWRPAIQLAPPWSRPLGLRFLSGWPALWGEPAPVNVMSLELLYEPGARRWRRSSLQPRGRRPPLKATGERPNRALQFGRRRKRAGPAALHSAWLRWHLRVGVD